MTKSIPKYGNTLTVIRLYGKRIINQIFKSYYISFCRNGYYSLALINLCSLKFYDVMKTVYPNLHAMRTIRMQHIWVSDRSSPCGRIISAPTLTLYFL